MSHADDHAAITRRVLLLAHTGRSEAREVARAFVESLSGHGVPYFRIRSSVSIPSRVWLSGNRWSAVILVTWFIVPLSGTRVSSRASGPKEAP